MASANENAQKYPFLGAHIAKEAHIYEVLDVISQQQELCLKNEIERCATLEDLQNSRTIKIPFTPARNKNIHYLADQLLKNYPDHIKPLYSFRFPMEETTKRLNIEEITELTVNLKGEEHMHLQIQRDSQSAEELMNLLARFRLFNITKLLKSTRQKSHISRLIKMELGKKIFTFKHYSLDKNLFETKEDYCFHQKNYEAVKNKMNIEELRNIVAVHSVPIIRRIKRYGILNTEFSDYRDTKLDYLLNILLEEIPNSLDKKDLTEVKNFASLRTCLMKVDQIIDPLVTLSDDIIRYIRDNELTSERDILSIFDSLNREMLRKWAEESAEKKRIFTYMDDHQNLYYFDSARYLTKITGLYKLILHETEKFDSLTEMEKKEYQILMTLLCRAGEQVLAQENLARTLFQGEQNIQRLQQIIREYEQYRKKDLEERLREPEEIPVRKQSLVQKIISFFSGIFGGKREAVVRQKAQTSPMKKTRKAPVSLDTRDIYNQIKKKSAPLLALSDFIKIEPENEIRIDTIIDELRSHQLKIVIPVYNARTVLYPVKSHEILMADIEYLLVDPEIIQSPEAIREYTDSLAGYKLKDETLPGKAILTVEKYLLTLYRQKKAKKLKK